MKKTLTLTTKPKKTLILTKKVNPKPTTGVYVKKTGKKRV